MIGNHNAVLVFNAFEQDVLTRVPLHPDHNETSVLQRLYITTGYEIFLLIENYEHNKYEIWSIDLDDPPNETDFSKKKLQIKKFFEYSKE